MIPARLSQLRINTLAGKVVYRVSIVQSLLKSVTLLYFYIETSLDNREALDSFHLP